MVNDESIRTILGCFTACNVKITDFLTYLLQDSQFQHHSLVLEIIDRVCTIPTALVEHPHTRQPMSQWVHNYVNNSHAKSLQDLARRDTGWHFNTTHATGQQIIDFRAEDIAQHVRQSAPELWTAVYSLLSLDANSLSRQATATSVTSEDANTDDDAYEAEFWKDFKEDETQDRADDAADMPSSHP